MVPFKETIFTKEDLKRAFGEGLELYNAQKIGLHNLLCYFGFMHGEAITKFYPNGESKQLLTELGILEGNYHNLQSAIQTWQGLNNGIYASVESIVEHCDLENRPLQQIYYGAPGTGKSHGISNIISGHDVIRTTFHPDSDYSTFVGAYKPVYDETKEKITYEFIQQSFTKAYIAAWKKYLTNTQVRKSTTNGLLGTTFNVSGAAYTIVEVTDSEIKTNKKAFIKKTQVQAIWNKFWETGSFEPASQTSGAGVQEAAAIILHNLVNSSDFDEAWESFVTKLSEEPQEGGTASGYKKYIFISVDDTGLQFISEESSSKRETLLEYYRGTNTAKGVGIGLVDILKKYDETDFNKAWNALKNNDKLPDESASTSQKTFDPVFLVIEEINRGNCAQIFGDLFQLLDRKNEGFSEYPIEADNDLTKTLKKEFDGWYIDDTLRKEIDNLYAKDYPKGVVNDVLSGKLLLLPNNLSILASMNTSDQSLFPMDSAFKRRWDWKYVPICEGVDKNGNKLNWMIKLDDAHEFIDWWQFLQQINIVIANLTSSEDKQLGYFFCSPDTKVEEEEKETVISAQRFVGKVIFYLWNDVFKDYAFDADCCKDKDNNNKEMLFAQFYEGKVVNTKTLTKFFSALENNDVKFIKDKVVTTPASNASTPFEGATALQVAETPVETPAAEVGSTPVE